MASHTLLIKSDLKFHDPISFLIGLILQSSGVANIWAGEMAQQVKALPSTYDVGPEGFSSTARLCGLSAAYTIIIQRLNINYQLNGLWQAFC